MPTFSSAQPQQQPPLRWPLVNRLQARNPSLPLTKDARLINCYAELDQEDNEYWVYKRLGLGTVPVFVGGSGAGLGLYTEPNTGTIHFVVGNTLYTASPGGIVGSGQSVGAAAPYFFETVPPSAVSSNQQIILGNGFQAYTYGVPTGPPFNRVGFGQITTNFPANFVNGFVYIDGTMYVMDLLGNIFGSAINNPASWSALNVIQASSAADGGVAIAKQLNYLIAFKQYTTQVFYDAGNAPPGSPLSPVPDAQIPLGCLHGNSVQSIDNSLLWLTSNQTISPQVVQMDNLVPKIVSTPAVERILDNATWTAAFAGNPGTTGIRSWVLKHGGHRFYALTIIFLNITLIYDLDQQLWYIWTDFQGNYWPIVALAFSEPAANIQGLHYAQHISNGNIYPLDGDYSFPNDYGNLYPVDVYTPNTDFGTIRRKFIKMMYFRSDQTPNSTLQVRYSDDDYQSWSNFRTVDLSVKKPRLSDCGTFKYRRAYHLRHQCNTAFRIKTIDLAMGMGTL